MEYTIERVRLGDEATLAYVYIVCRTNGEKVMEVR